ncbi:SPOR domain-containing protein [Fictibacillus sp. NRS-1165]|uniref:SPOR domain-containing protein n=1 Tax=Fictibacillus sp. NRS-1165 TaxID=3144463 RepID=UPI003D25EDF6
MKKQSSVKKPQKPADGNYRVIAGSFKDKANAENHVKALKKKGIEAFIDVVR